MSYVMAIALICGSRYGDMYSNARVRDATACQYKLANCVGDEKGDLDTRLIKCIRKGN